MTPAVALVYQPTTLPFHQTLSRHSNHSPARTSDTFNLLASATGQRPLSTTSSPGLTLKLAVDLVPAKVRPITFPILIESINGAIGLSVNSILAGSDHCEADVAHVRNCN
jgi:hypothetical protein